MNKKHNDPNEGVNPVEAPNYPLFGELKSSVVARLSWS